MCVGGYKEMGCPGDGFGFILECVATNNHFIFDVKKKDFHLFVRHHYIIEGIGPVLGMGWSCFCC